MVKLPLIILAASSLLLASSVAPAADSRAVSVSRPVGTGDASGQTRTVWPLLSLVPGGQTTAVRLTGLSNAQYFDFGTRNDEAVTRIVLRLRYLASPALLAESSQLNVYLNNQLEDSVPLRADLLGKVAEAEIVLDPAHVGRQNQLTLRFAGHYQVVCENPANDTLWLSVDPASELVLEGEKLRLSNDLSLFPAPFIQSGGAAVNVLPVVFAGPPGEEELKAAAVMASLAGKLADWRGVHFPVYFDSVPAEGHFLVIASDGRRPSFLSDMTPPDGPEIRLANAPFSRYAKMLLVTGRSPAELVAAARSFAAEERTMIGERLRLTAVSEPAPRQPYDAPRWLPPETAVPFADLIEYAGQLIGDDPLRPTARLPLRLAPDLLLSDVDDLSAEIRFRYTRPSPGDKARFQTRLNDTLADSLNFDEQNGRGEARVNLGGLLGTTDPGERASLSPTAVRGLTFALDYSQSLSEGTPQNCRSITLMPQHLEIEPGSLITLQRPYHWARMPDISLFARSGYPFSVYADLSRAALLTGEGSPAEISSLLDAVGRIAAATGLAALNMTVASGVDDPRLRDKDILWAIDRPTGPGSGLLSDLSQSGARRLSDELSRSLRDGRAPAAPADTGGGVSDGGAGALLGFQSPFDSERSVVALLSDGQRGALELQRRLSNPSDLAGAVGAATVMTADRYFSFPADKTYFLGDLPWYRRLWLTLSRHPLLVIGSAIISALLIGAGVLSFMRRQIRRRS